MTPKFRREVLPLEKLKVDEREAARHPPESIQQLSLDILAHGLIHAISVLEDGYVIAGTGRTLAARLAKLATVSVNVFPGTLTPTEIKLIRGAENLQRTDYKPFQKFTLCSELMAENPDWTQGELAKRMHLSEGMISRILSPSKLTEEWHELLKQGKITLLECAKAAQLLPEQRAGLLNLHLSGEATREQVEAITRKPRTTPTTKLDRIKLALPGGITVVVTGEALDIDGLADALLAASTATKTGIKEKIDAPTLVKFLASKQKAGGS